MIYGMFYGRLSTSRHTGKVVDETVSEESFK